MLDTAIKVGADLYAGSQKDKATREANLQNAALQREFAQNSIRWRVDDARAAGIHPAFAIGAPTISPSASFSPQHGMADALASSSQDISRAINATRTTPERLNALRMTELQMDGLKLDNDIKRASIASQLQRIIQNQNPPMPSIAADANEPFHVPENKKSEERPPLMLFGKRVLTPPGTSPMKAWEDQIGDDGPLSWLAQLAVGAHMLQHNWTKRFRAPPDVAAQKQWNSYFVKRR